MLPIYVAVAVVALAIIAVIVARTRQTPPGRLTPLAGLAMAFVVSAILFGEDRLVGYGLIGVGVALAVLDIVQQRRRRSEGATPSADADGGPA